jgi:hypothetical protein
MNKYQILAENGITTTGNESKYQRKYKKRKRLSSQVGSNRVITIPELKQLRIYR